MEKEARNKMTKKQGKREKKRKKRKNRQKSDSCKSLRGERECLGQVCSFLQCVIVVLEVVNIHTNKCLSKTFRNKHPEIYPCIPNVRLTIRLFGIRLPNSPCFFFSLPKTSFPHNHLSLSASPCTVTNP